MKFTVETQYIIYNDGDNMKTIISPDADGLGCVDVSVYDNTGKRFERLTFSPEEAELVANSMLKLVKELKAQP